MCGQLGHLKKNYHKVNRVSSISGSKSVYEDTDSIASKKSLIIMGDDGPLIINEEGILMVSRQYHGRICVTTSGPQDLHIRVWFNIYARYVVEYGLSNKLNMRVGIFKKVIDMCRIRML